MDEGCFLVLAVLDALWRLLLLLEATNSCSEVTIERSKP